MKRPLIKQKSKKYLLTGTAITLIVFFTLLFAGQGWAFETEGSKKIQLELFVDGATFNPADLNLLVDCDNEIQMFFYDSQFTHLTNSNQIRYWSKSKVGKRKKLTYALPVGLRLKYFLSRSLAVSFGMKYLSRDETHSLVFSYVQNRYYGVRFIEQEEYSPYSLSAEGLSAVLGLHLIKNLSDHISLEGYVGGGPLFARCSYLSRWKDSWVIQEMHTTLPANIREGLLEQQGKGTGIAVELGMRMNNQLNKWLGIFVAAGYSYQKVRHLSGSGREVIGQNSQDWIGEWGIKRETIISPWGSLTLEFPTNYWPSGDNRMRGFVLDMSGFQVRLGLFFRL